LFITNIKTPCPLQSFKVPLGVHIPVFEKHCFKAPHGQELFRVPLKAPRRHLCRLLLKTSLPRCRRSFWGCPARLIRKISSECSSPTITSRCPAHTLTHRHTVTHTHTHSQFRLKYSPTSVAWHQSGQSRCSVEFTVRSTESATARSVVTFSVYLPSPCFGR